MSHPSVSILPRPWLSDGPAVVDRIVDMPSSPSPQHRQARNEMCRPYLEEDLWKDS
jgi:hypothetical protein